MEVVIYPIPNLSECPICQARADQIENHHDHWFCNGCSCQLILTFSIEPVTGIQHGRIVRKMPAQHLYEADINGAEMDGP